MTQPAITKAGDHGPADRRSSLLSKTGANIATVALFLIMVTTVVDVLSRSLFGRSVPGMIESAEVILVAGAFLGLGYAQRIRAHVSTSFFVDAIPRRAARFIKRTGLLILAFYVGWAAIVCVGRAWDAFQGGEVRFGLIQIPQWPARAAIAIGFALLFIEVLRDLRRRLP